MNNMMFSDLLFRVSVSFTWQLRETRSVIGRYKPIHTVGFMSLLNPRPQLYIYLLFRRIMCVLLCLICICL